MNRIFAACLSFVALSVSMEPARAQSFNVDIDGTFGTPGPGFAALASAGAWNNIVANGMAAQPLVGLDGLATGVTLMKTAGIGGAFSFNNALTLGDDQALMDDAEDPGTLGSTWVFSNLAAGQYDVTTYAWAPDNAMFTSGVSVNGAPVQLVGGSFSAGYALGVTHAFETVLVPAGGSIQITLSVILSFATFNGVQLVRHSPAPPLSFCAGAGAAPVCPCGNNGAAGNGCASASVPAGANLAASGTNSVAADTLVLSGSGMPPTSTCLYVSGPSQGLAVGDGDGLRCVAGTLQRLRIPTNLGGTSVLPQGGEPPLSVLSNAVAGDVRYYQVIYREAMSFCMPATFNWTNAVGVVWSP